YREARLIAKCRPRDREQGACVRLPFSPRDLLEDVDLELAVRHHLLEAAVFLLELPQALDVGGFQAAEMLPPGVDRLRTDAVLLGHLGHGPLVGLPEDRDHLLFAESRLLHGSLDSPRAPFSSFSWSENHPTGQAT